MLYLVALLVSLYSTADASDCTTTTSYNVQFIIDESGSVGPGGYALTVDFVNNLIENDISADAPVSIFEFSSDVDVIYRFNQPQSPRSLMTDALSASTFDDSLTATATAVQEGIDEYNRAATDGDLVQGDRLMFIITDGVPNRGGDPCTLKSTLDALDITVILIGVGGFNQDPVECLADNDRDTIIQIADFTQDAFDAVEDQISVTTCPPPDDGCETTAEYSIQFLVDESGSVPIAGYDLSIGLVQDLIENDISPQAKISSFEFGTGVQTIYRFDQLQNPRQPMINTIGSASRNGGVTNTRAAVQAGIDEYNRALTDGDIENDDPKLLVLLTDGKPCCNSLADPCPLKPVLNDLDIQVIIIGVGSFDRTNVDCLATNPADSVIEVAAFTADAFAAVEAQIAEETCPDQPFEVPPDPLPCKEAQEYCKSKGSNLATIIDNDDRAAAQAALNTAGEAFGFIGLYSDDVETKWQYRSGEECPSASAYRCVDFWRTAPGGFENRPRCIGDGEGGYGCAVIYADDGTVDNDKPDIVAFPFLCDGDEGATVATPE